MYAGKIPAIMLAVIDLMYKPEGPLHSSSKEHEVSVNSEQNIISQTYDTLP